MAILLDDLLCEISNAICNANNIMEGTALNQYVEQGYERALTANNNTESDSYVPLTFNLALRQEQEIRKIPIAALMHNTTMRLEQVDIKLKFKMYEQDGNIMVDCMPHNSSNESLDEMTLQFKNSVSSEGISKITDSQMKHI